MVIGTKIDGHKEISMGKDLFVYNKPKYVYIPLICGNDTDVTIEVKKGDYVFKGDAVAHRKGALALPIHSSVSGKVTNIEEKMILSGNMVSCITIENDFKEEYKEKVAPIKQIDKYSKDEFIELLKDSGIRGLGGADFPTYIKYKTNTEIKHLIINAVECEPYITADYEVMKLYYAEILETIDAIMTINNISNGYIAVKKTNKEVISLLEKVIGTYPKIKIVKVPNIYPMGWEKNIIRYILKKEYKRLPMEVNAIVNNVSTIYSVYNLLKYKRPLTERIVTFTGEMFESPVNALLKIGTNVKEVLDTLKIKKGKKIMIAGGPMMGKEIKGDELIVTPNLNDILLLPVEDKEKESQCLRCGLCSNNCPVRLSPVMIKDNMDNIEELKKLDPVKCISCGLCSYVCPAKINLRNYVQEAKDKLRRD